MSPMEVTGIISPNLALNSETNAVLMNPQLPPVGRTMADWLNWLRILGYILFLHPT